MSYDTEYSGPQYLLVELAPGWTHVLDAETKRSDRAGTIGRDLLRIVYKTNTLCGKSTVHKYTRPLPGVQLKLSVITCERCRLEYGARMLIISTVE